MASGRGAREDGTITIMVRYLLPLLATATMTLTSFAQTQFEWVNPHPHAQDWTDMAYGNGRFVGITDGFGGRPLYTSADGETWTRPSVPVATRLWDITFADGKFVAVGDGNHIVVSEDGTNWTLRTIEGAYSLYRVAFGNGVWVVQAGGAQLYSSADLQTWERADIEMGFTFFGLAFGNGTFVAMGEYGHLFRSADGRNWARLPWPNLSSYGRLIFSNGRFLWNQTEGVAYSTDGLNWTPTAQREGFNHLNATPDGFIAHGRGDVIQTSRDGENWETVGTVTLPFNGHISCGAFAPGKSILAGNSGLLFESSDGATWTRRTFLAQGRANVAFANGQFIRYGAAGMHISRDGAEWEPVANSPALGGLAGGNGLWIGVNEDGSALYTSRNGREWAAASGVSGTFHKRVVFGGGLFAIGNSSGVVTTTDGETWRQSSLSGSVGMIGYLNGRMAGALADRTPVTSDDGVTWTVHSGKTMWGGPHFAVGNDRIVSTFGAGMGPGNCAWSADGINWVVEPSVSGTTHLNGSLAFGNGLFMEADSYGNIYESRDGIHWTGGRQAPQGFTAVAFGNGVWVAVAGDSTLRSVTNRSQSVGTARVGLRFANDGQLMLRAEGAANATVMVRHAAEIDGAWSDVTTVRLSIDGSAEIPAPVGNTKGFFSATVVGQ